MRGLSFLSADVSRDHAVKHGHLSAQLPRLTLCIATAAHCRLGCASEERISRIFRSCAKITPGKSSMADALQASAREDSVLRVATGHA